MRVTLAVGCAFFATLVGVAACGSSDDEEVGASATDLSTTTEASEPDSTTTESVASTSAPTPTTEAPQALSWRFRLTTEDGWEYDALIEIPTTFDFEVSLTNSPPDAARVAVAIAGSPNVVFSPATPGRTPPALAARQIRGTDEISALFAPGTEAIAQGNNNVSRTVPCDSSGGAGDRAPDVGMWCGTWEPGSFETNDVDEAVAQQIVDAAASGPMFFTIRLDTGCLPTLLLNLDGSVLVADSAYDCVVIG